VCFSAAGSFTLSAVLAGVGAASVAANSSRSVRLFAAVPLIFGAQQAAEGIVWLTIASPSDAMVNRVAVFAFLALALVVWPVWLPYSLRLAETDDKRRRILTAFLSLGVCVAATALVLLLRSIPVAVVAGRSIRYDRSGSSVALVDSLVLLAYVLPTIGPFFVSSMRLTRTIGTTLVLSLVASAVIERDATTSVWCFFAAILSGLVFVAVTKSPVTTPLRPADEPA